MSYVLPWGTFYRALYGYMAMLSISAQLQSITISIDTEIAQTLLGTMCIPLNSFNLSPDSSVGNSNPKTTSPSRACGPHNIDILSVIVGNLLGDSYGEKRVNGTRFHIHMCSTNVEYLMFIHKFYSSTNYASANKPKLSKSIGKHSKIYFSYKFRTYSYISFNYIYDMFYKAEYSEGPQNCNVNNVNNVKRLPQNIKEYLTPLTLAIWIMSDGKRTTGGLSLYARSFTNAEVARLKDCLERKFHFEGLKLCSLGSASSACSAQLKEDNKSYIYFPKSEMQLLSKLVKPYFVKSMYYKLNGF